MKQTTTFNLATYLSLGMSIRPNRMGSGQPCRVLGYSVRLNRTPFFSSKKFSILTLNTILNTRRGGTYARSEVGSCSLVRERLHVRFSTINCRPSVSSSLRYVATLSSNFLPEDKMKKC